MKFIDNQNGRTLAAGRLETSKIDRFARESDEKQEILFTFDYDMSNILPSNRKNSFAREEKCFCVCYIGNDNLFSFEACLCEETGYLTALIRLTPDEKELFLCWILNRELSIKE